MSALTNQKELKQTRITVTAMLLMFFIGCGGDSGSRNDNNDMCRQFDYYGNPIIDPSTGLPTLAPCNNNNTQSVSISISPAARNMLVGETLILYITSRPENADFTFSVNPVSGSGCIKSNNNAITCKPLWEGEYRVTVTPTADISKTVSARITVADPNMIGENFEEIYTPIELYTKITNDLSGNYRLMANISLDIYDNWLPIGTSSTPFTGKITGNGYKISGLKINRRTVNYVGLFGYVNGGTIINLALEGVDIVGGRYAGAIAGYINNTTIINSYSKGDISAISSTYNDASAGGIVGYLMNLRKGEEGWTYPSVSNLSIINCYSMGNISSSEYSGGIAGYVNDSSVSIVNHPHAIITNSYSTGDISGHYAGGVTGYVTSGTPNYTTVITDSYSTGNVSGYYAGGIAGYLLNSTGNNNTITIADCYSIGDISASVYAGGIAGRVTGSITITNSYSKGDISATIFSDYGSAPAYAGGIAGASNATIINSYSAGNIFSTSTISSNSPSSSTASTYAGGIAGVSNATIINSYSIGDVYAIANAPDSSRAFAYSGGIAGYATHAIINCAAINRAVNSNLFAGRIVGYITNATIYNNFALNIMNVLGSELYPEGRGVDRTDAQLKIQNTYSDTIVGDGVGGLGWKFGNNADNPWKMPSNNGYPIFYWQ